MTGSPAFIKDEPDDFAFNPNKFISSNGIGMSQQYGTQFSSSGDVSGVDPSNLTVNSNIMNNHFGSHMSGSFGMGNAGIADDELEQLIDDQSGSFQTFNGNYNMNSTNQGGYFPEQVNNNSMPMGNQGNAMSGQMFSNTPDNAPITSPFVNEFNYNQYRPMQQGFASMGMQNGFDVNSRHRKIHSLERHPSDSRAPMTPKTPAINSLHIGTPDSANLPAHIMNQQLHQHAKSSQWDGTPGSGHSWLESPISSPHGHPHAQISEMISGKHASLPTKVEGAHSASLPAFQSQEAKKKRRRESHNLVERRRRDNINERIQDLSRLVPQHRLEDEKVRKHISANGPMSPTGISPPHATSLLAGGTGRRATAGNITQGLPIEEKDKGPNKGDILNGAVSWMRDLMWSLYEKERREEELRSYIQSIGGTWPLETTEDGRRMTTELIDAVDRNGADNFDYSRGPGSGLRVPKHTNYAGEPLDSSQRPSGQRSNDPGSTGSSNFWQNGGDSGRASMSLKEEMDEDFGMEMS